LDPKPLLCFSKDPISFCMIAFRRRQAQPPPSLAGTPPGYRTVSQRLRFRVVSMVGWRSMHVVFMLPSPQPGALARCVSCRLLGVAMWLMMSL
jgi:hypothetical protein